jgi:hypothetical protein
VLATAPTKQKRRQYQFLIYAAKRLLHGSAGLRPRSLLGSISAEVERPGPPRFFVRKVNGRSLPVSHIGQMVSSSGAVRLPNGVDGVAEPGKWVDDPHSMLSTRPRNDLCNVVSYRTSSEPFPRQVRASMRTPRSHHSLGACGQASARGDLAAARGAKSDYRCILPSCCLATTWSSSAFSMYCDRLRRSCSANFCSASLMSARMRKEMIGFSVISGVPSLTLANLPCG